MILQYRVYIQFQPTVFGIGVSSSALNFRHPVLTPQSVSRNGKALDYESRDSGFDPHHDHNLFFVFKFGSTS